MYESYGVIEYVIIDPLEVSAEVYRSTEQSFILKETVYAEGNLTLQTINGFSVPFKKLFL